MASRIILLDTAAGDAGASALAQRLRALGCVVEDAHGAAAVGHPRQEVTLLVDSRLPMDEVVAQVQRLLRPDTPISHAAPAVHGLDKIIGTSPRMTEIKTLIGKIALSPASTVLITGESGTGKDLVAKVLHEISQRACAPFMTITCSALPESLLESELFGHERGAFTDAKARKKGLFELAAQGTVFLDEVAELSLALQAKLLRFLEEKTFKRVGGAQDVHVDVRVVAATNRCLEDRVRLGLFREDLYYRLRVLPISLPPLRDRGADIEALARHYLTTFCQTFDKQISDFSAAARQTLIQHTWPGNARELRNIIERAVLLAESDVIEPSDLTTVSPDAPATPFALPATGVDLAALERDMVRQALARTGGNQTRAAALLGMNRDQIRYRMEKFARDVSASTQSQG